MKKSLTIIFIFSFLWSCEFIRTDDSINLGDNYRYIQDYPNTIIYHKTSKYEGTGKEIVPPIVIAYKYNEVIIIVKTIDLDDKQHKYWIVDKRCRGTKVEPLDSITFYKKLIELDIELRF